MANVKDAHRYYDRKVNYFIAKFVGDVLNNRIPLEDLNGDCDYDFMQYLNDKGIDTFSDWSYFTNSEAKFTTKEVHLRKLNSTTYDYCDYAIQTEYEDLNGKVKSKSRTMFFLELMRDYFRLKPNYKESFCPESIEWLLCLKPLSDEEIKNHCGGAKTFTNIDNAAEFVFGKDSFYYIKGYVWLGDGKASIYTNYFKA